MNSLDNTKEDIEIDEKSNLEIAPTATFLYKEVSKTTKMTIKTIKNHSKPRDFVSFKAYR